jgi:ABC-type nitrate/sulfonate/bicarbonate transport system permease component
VHVFGGGRFTALRKVNLPGAAVGVRRGARVGAGP